MKSIQFLAREAAESAGRAIVFDDYFKLFAERFHALAIAEEHKRLLEGSGEAVGRAKEHQASAVLAADRSVWLADNFNASQEHCDEAKEKLRGYAELLRELAYRESTSSYQPLWVVIDDMNQPTYCAGWKAACHDHINDAIDRGYTDAVRWVVRQAFAADQMAAAVLRTTLAERERIADELEHGFVDDEGHHIQYAAAIRNTK